SKEYLKTIVEGKTILLQTIKDRKEKYGRYLGEVWIEKSEGKFENVNDLIVKNGFAVYKKY
ncbi:MAG: thermonuclease family protein, partial [Ignavibacteria bacterium]|nr:thermonuclease family protein [Ignavibacteria bacterium]